MNHNLLALLFAIAAIIPATAGETKSSPCRLRVLCVAAHPAASDLVIAEKSATDWSALAAVTAAANARGGPIKVKVRKLALAIGSPPSQPAAKPGAGMLRPADGKLAAAPFAEFELPDGPAAAIALIPTADAAKPYQVRVIDTSASGFAGGSVLVHNGSNKTVTGTIGNHELKLEPGKQEVVALTANLRGDMAGINLVVREGGDDTLVCDTRWRAKAPHRSYLIVVPLADDTLTAAVFSEHPPFR